MLEHNTELGELAVDFPQVREEAFLCIEDASALREVQRQPQQGTQRKTVRLTSPSTSLGTSPCKLSTISCFSISAKTSS